MEDPVDERRELYDRFRDEISRPLSERYFDEKELVEIYDLAGDYDDEYVQMEVLMLAFHLYPDSEELAIRRAFLYYKFNLDEGVTDISRRYVAPEISPAPLWSILDVREKSLPRDEAIAVLQRLLDESDEFDDETVIQFVDAAVGAGAYDWLKTREKILKEKFPYQQTLLYELYVMALSESDHEYALKMLEELTRLDPFSADYWVALAEVHFLMGKYDEAISAADFALAVDSADARALTFKCRSMLALGRDAAGVVTLMEPVVTANPDDAGAVQVLGVAYLDSGRTPEAMALFDRYNRKFPDNREIVDYMLIAGFSKISDVLNRYYDAVAEDGRSENEWVGWAKRYVAQGRYPQGVMILECYHRNAGLDSEGRAFFFSTVYAAGFYRAMAEYLVRYLEDPELASTLPIELAIGGVLSLARLNCREEAVRYGNMILDNEYYDIGNWSMKNVMAFSGFYSMMRHIVDTLKSNPKVAVASIDPFMPPRDATDND